jgi:hypothetical protein
VLLVGCTAQFFGAAFIKRCRAWRLPREGKGFIRALIFD